MTDKRDYDRELDDIFEKYSDFLTEKWAGEMEELLESLESDDSNTEGTGGSSDGSSSDSSGGLYMINDTPEKKPNSTLKQFLRYAAVFALVAVFAVVIPSTDASAWHIWHLDFFSSEEEDHTQVGAENENSFAKYYIRELPEGYTLEQESVTEDVMVKQIYYNESNKKVHFSQYNKEAFVSQLDSENGDTREERIGDFKVLVYESDEDILGEITTDSNVLFIYTTDSFDVFKSFIEKLEEK